MVNSCSVCFHIAKRHNHSRTHMDCKGHRGAELMHVRANMAPPGAVHMPEQQGMYGCAIHCLGLRSYRSLAGR